MVRKLNSSLTYILLWRCLRSVGALSRDLTMPFTVFPVFSVGVKNLFSRSNYLIISRIDSFERSPCLEKQTGSHGGCSALVKL